MTAAPAPPKPTPPRDSFREAVETLVFVVTLVLMLKLFAVEAFVIPTGSMAETLYGIQKLVTCPDCGHEYPVNSTDEVEPQGRGRGDDNDGGNPRLASLSGACCPNCRHTYEWGKEGGKRPDNNSGDRVLVHKAIYALSRPSRADVVVFKFPVDPQLEFSAQNYIKRLWGLGGETIVIYRGDLYRATALTYPADELDTFGTPKYPRPAPGDEARLWEGPAVRDGSRTSPKYPPPGVEGVDYTYHNSPDVVARFASDLAAGFKGTAFEPIRKPASAALSMRRVVYDNAHQSKYLLDRGVPARWQPDGAGWKPATTSGPRSFAHAVGEGRLAYTHRVPGPPTEVPALNAFDRSRYATDRDRLAGGYQDGMYPASAVTNFLGYNTAESGGQPRRDVVQFPVGDLMLEATVTLDAGATATLELSKGTRRFRATCREAGVTLTVVGPGGGDLGTSTAKLAAGKAHDVRFSNFDSQLRVWVGGRLLEFPGEGLYTPWESSGFDAASGAALGGVFAPAAWAPTAQNDIASPAAVAVTGGVTVAGLRLFADTYFSPAGTQRGQDADPSDPVDTFYVQPGHYFCLGDNSGQSLDGRVWGLVPERLMLGKAMFVFWPHNRVGFIK